MYIITGQDETHLLYATQSYTMFIYLKKKLTFSTIIQDKQNIQTNITCSLHLLMKIYSNVYIF